MGKIELYLGDCLKVLAELNIQVDAVITDLPYGTTACAWDTIIPIEPMWQQVRRVLKRSGVFITTACQPFTSKLVMSNEAWYRQELIWHKTMPVGFLDAKFKHLKAHENILLFAPTGKGYNFIPQMKKGEPYGIKHHKKISAIYRVRECYRTTINEGERYPTSVLDFELPADTVLEFSNRNYKSLHHTQKPVDLYEYLIRTFTRPGDVVLDIAMGSGTTGVAAKQNGRDFIGIEIVPEIFEVARRRIDQAQPPLFVAETKEVRASQDFRLVPMFA